MKTKSSESWRKPVTAESSQVMMVLKQHSVKAGGSGECGIPEVWPRSLKGLSSVYFRPCQEVLNLKGNG